MISTKMMVYSRPDGGTRSAAVGNSERRRKKSTGELFQKGYRVRSGHGQAAEKEERDTVCYNLGSCFHLVSYWGKEVGGRDEEEGEGEGGRRRRWRWRGWRTRMGKGEEEQKEEEEEAEKEEEKEEGG